MAACNSMLLYHFLGLASLAAVFYFSLLGEVNLRFPGLLPSPRSSMIQPQPHDASLPFVERRGVQLFLEDRPFYINGWNSYWLMAQSVETSSRHRVSGMFRAATGMGLTVCRTWAFNDGGYNALQLAPGRFDERVFKALDRVVVEARQHGVRLILSLADNLEAYGGKTQYVKWAWDEGVGLTASNDSFFFDPAIRDYFKVYIKALLTRKNHLTGVQYKDDPTILAWELMNEPRCITDPSGNTLQRWIEEMASYVKSIDRRHLLTVGTEGFYGPTSPPEKLSVNPGHWFNNYGLDFIRNSKISDIDFASVHLYPDNWLQKANLEDKLKFVTQWVTSHFEDGDKELNKPVLLTEFGLSRLVKGFDQSHRDAFYKAVYDIAHESAQRGGAGAGAMVWQLAVEDMEDYHDAFSIVPSETPSMQKLLKEQSCRLAALRHGEAEAKILKTVCA
ncbi:mannan endo-1,4-beta-mannosidase 2-like [Lolium rigidum]|uniref:mannan endo-1,4-beta-mannosidase 2-like n=1 Tax=Lolium rigidum TaxID=89674 RepID=UPI001F5D16E2|nr:mannan endo-1,4-beta-mannosidase 2-like [Lolium rigidum]